MAENQPMQVKREAPQSPETVRSPLMSLRNEIDRVFEDFMWPPFRGSLLRSPLTRLGLLHGAPSADVIERDDCYEIDVDLPGVDKDDIEIALSDNTLTVRCEVKEEKEEKGEEFYMCERRHESCARSFALPSGIDMDKVEADLKNGVLKIMLPKTEEAQKKPRRVEVRAH